MRKILPITPLILLLFSIAAFSGIKLLTSESKSISTPLSIVVTPTPNPPTPTPTPKPLTFEELNKLYGPCTRLSTLMYHHVRPDQEAKDQNQQYLNVTPETFRSHLQYLKDRGYRIATMQELINFFDAGTPIPPKSVLVTFDDGYTDFALHAAPIISEFSAPTTLFLSTGLAENPDYLTWSQVQSLPTQVLVGNHTWSHKNMGAAASVVANEITLADTQLNERDLNNPKTFAYPYGIYSQNAENTLKSLDYKLAFTTRPGNILCKQQRFSLPRVRIGNSPLSNYGF